MARLERTNESDSMVAGVCGGLAKYTGIDSTIIRVVYVILALWGGIGLIPYIILWICMPRERDYKEQTTYPVEVKRKETETFESKDKI